VKLQKNKLVENNFKTNLKLCQTCQMKSPMQSALIPALVFGKSMQVFLLILTQKTTDSSTGCNALHHSSNVSFP